MNIFEYFRECAKFMSADRDDLWPNEQSAYEQLLRWHDYLNARQTPVEFIGSGGYELERFENEEITEWSLTRKIADFTVYTQDVETGTFNWTKDSSVFPEIDTSLES